MLVKKITKILWRNLRNIEKLNQKKYEIKKKIGKILNFMVFEKLCYFCQSVQECVIYKYFSPQISHFSKTFLFDFLKNKSSKIKDSSTIWFNINFWISIRIERNILIIFNRVKNKSLQTPRDINYDKLFFCGFQSKLEKFWWIYRFYCVVKSNFKSGVWNDEDGVGRMRNLWSGRWFMWESRDLALKFVS